MQPSNASQNLVKALECVGFANEDFSALRYVRDQIKATRLFHPLDLLADPDDPRDLFGMLQRASQSRF
jgi:ornithine cyclodeaminase